jgi:hypothetical protein
LSVAIAISPVHRIDLCPHFDFSAGQDGKVIIQGDQGDQRDRALFCCIIPRNLSKGIKGIKGSSQARDAPKLSMEKPKGAKEERQGCQPR